MKNPKEIMTVDINNDRNGKRHRSNTTPEVQQASKKSHEDSPMNLGNAFDRKQIIESVIESIEKIEKAAEANMDGIPLGYQNI